MTIPISIIILGISLILLLVYVILYWQSYVPIASPEANEADNLALSTPDANMPSISVIIIAHDADSVLAKTIDDVARQDYPNFEILIVNNASSDNTTEVIRRAQSKYPQLVRDTYLPRNMSGIVYMHIAETLGIRSSRKDWVVLLRPNSSPKSPLWLRSIAAGILKGYSLCLGYNSYYGYEDSPWVRKSIAWRRNAQILNYRAINRGKKKPIEAECSNIAFSKVDFFINGGFGRWLDVRNYHESLYATTFVESNNAVMLTHPEAQVDTLLPPIEELWQTDVALINGAHKKFSKQTKRRRKYYTRLNILMGFAIALLLLGTIFSLCSLPIDNSTTFIDFNIPLGDINISVISFALFILFLIATLVHFIKKSIADKQDIQNLTSTIVGRPSLEHGGTFFN